jgi:hypothetical protein
MILMFIKLEPPMWTQKNRPRYDRDHLRYPSDLTDEWWAVVAPLIPPPPSSTVRA